MNELIISLKKCTVKGNIVSLPKEMLANYADVRKALINASGKYKANTFVFSSDAQPYIDRLTSGESVNIKKEFQFFATQPEEADWLVELAFVKGFHSKLETSAGDGAIIQAIKRSGIESVVDYCELMPENRSVLEKKIKADTIHADYIMEDFLKMPVEKKYDRIIANPPFSNNQDIIHVRKMYNHLASGGRLVSIMSKHWQFASEKACVDFRKWLEGLDHEIHEIESGKFKASGTMIATVAVVIRKL